MLEVLCRALAFPKIGKQVGQVDARTKMIVIDSEALLEVLNALLEVFHLLIAHADVEERVRLWRPLALVLRLDLDRLLEGIYGRLPLTELVINLALQK